LEVSFIRIEITFTCTRIYISSLAPECEEHLKVRWDNDNPSSEDMSRPNSWNIM